MPRFNGTGPWGAGPGTGWGLGPCGYGRGYGKGFGRGYGLRRWTTQDQRFALEEEVELLKQELSAAQEELKNLKSQKK